MNRIIVIQFITVDGVTEDPDGSGGTPGGGWAFRHGPRVVADDKFELGSRLESGVLLFGRRTWEQFSKRWPGRSGEFATRMNAACKLVASRTVTDVSAWENSAVINGELTDEVPRLRRERDIIVVGSTSVVHTLMQHDLVDEYRLLVFPVVLGAGHRLFGGHADVGELRLLSVEQRDAAALLCYEVARSRPTAGHLGSH